MAEHGAQYDHIGNKYDEYARTATQKRAESYTVLRMVGPLAGKRVLDLACGFGFYTRLLKQHGAAEVIGIDISPEMARLGREHEQAEPLGVTYQVSDGAAYFVRKAHGGMALEDSLRRGLNRVRYRTSVG